MIYGCDGARGGHDLSRWKRGGGGILVGNEDERGIIQI